MVLSYFSYNQVALLLILFNTTIPTCLGSGDTLKDTTRRLDLARKGGGHSGESVSHVDPSHADSSLAGFDSSSSDDENFSTQLGLLTDHGDSPQGKPNEPDPNQPQNPEPPVASPESAWNADSIERLMKELKEIADIFRSCIPYIKEMQNSFSAKPDQPGANAQPCADLLNAYRPLGLNNSQSSLSFPAQNSSWSNILDPLSNNCQNAKLAFPKGGAQACRNGLVQACSESAQRSYQSWYEMGTRQCYEGLQRSSTASSSSSGPTVTKAAYYPSSSPAKSFSSNSVGLQIPLLAWMIISVGLVAAVLL
jgi:hypothetical protein